ncbi:major facilitator superfamily protein, putative [Ichthyophthirius multifiliis]|uniref:Major facilitator superfamily protein, putative n=1 Tax=Ichthyophthirius multifiliis TaxID=5932 RepID=G0QTE7_ICHMU|nr:major facilitator superfamily protein, putative [Ichthyophthirius multifiliis]EGR31524.1 major facilitator superfamily protein, putative [Ichthyophthirius multifiliis]|eukprot:XP_004035010.1 major facilitator superfamily protein, putative [Ichthyophthirius multifiliis]
MSFYDVNNFENPRLIGEFNLNNAQNDCDDITSDSSENFLGCANGFYGFYIIDISNLNDIKIYAQYDEIFQQNGVESIIFDDELSFGFYAVRETGVGYFEIEKQNIYIGEKVSLLFIPLYSLNDVKFAEVYYYDNYQRQKLPNWGEFIQSQSKLNLKIDKSILNQNKQKPNIERHEIDRNSLHIVDKNLISQNIFQ